MSMFDDDNVIFSRIAHFRKGAIVNFYGVVVDWFSPRKSLGTDYIIGLKIVDESLDSPFRPIIVNMFSRYEYFFPRVLCIGGVIKLCGVSVRNCKGSLIGVSSHAFSYVSFTYRQSSICVSESSFSPCSVTCMDTKRVTELMEWYRGLRKAFHSEDYLPGSLVTNGMMFNFRGQILRINESPDKRFLMIAVSDYTENAKFRRLWGFGPRVELRCFLWGRFSDMYRNRLATGDFIIIERTKTNMYNGDMVVNISEKYNTDTEIFTVERITSWIEEYLDRKLSTGVALSLKLSDASRFSKRVQSIVANNCTETCTVAEAKKQNLFHCVARIYRIFPSAAEEIVIRACTYCKILLPRFNFHDICLFCHRDTIWTYIFVILAVDETGFVPVVCYGQQARALMNNISPQSLKTNSFDRDLARLRMAALKGSYCLLKARKYVSNGMGIYHLSATDIVDIPQHYTPR